MLHRITIILCLGFMAACTTFPDLDAQTDPALQNASFPEFLTQPQMRNLDAPRPNLSLRDLTGRLAQLRARAKNLRRSILTTAERRRLAQNIR